MAKPNRTNLKSRPRLDNIIIQGLIDIGHHLPEEARREIIFLITSDRLGDALTYIDLKLDQAESASVGFLELAAWRQLNAFYKKNVDSPGTTAQGRKDAAIAKFLESEETCRETNERLSFYSEELGCLSNDMQHVVSRTRDIIEDIVGPLGHIQLFKIAASAGFGPGFTFSSTEPAHRNLYYKVKGPHSVTREAIPYVKFFLNHCEPWKQALVTEGCTYSIVDGNRLTTVAKTAVIDRTIAIEPSLNVYMQKGVDSYLSKRLRRHGVTLDDQARNHGPAKLGSSVPLEAATVDLSSASDCVSIEVVRMLFPREWFVLLDDLRSKNYTLDKGMTWCTYEKFSSMGNAFTFPVESILFYAIAKACTILAGEELTNLRVYGDDIVVAPGAYALLVEALQFFGFSVNLDKSFVFGFFRETCGSDFYQGVDLRPVYVKSVPSNDQEVYNLYNRLVWNRVGFQLHSLCRYLLECVDKPLWGPPHLPPGQKFWKWYAGKAVQTDHYLHADPSYGERFAYYDNDLQCKVWRLQLLRFIPLKEDTSTWNLQFRYLAFLLGMQSGKVDSNSRFRRLVTYEKITYWPDMPWRPYLDDL
jgi:hypothetical protein